MKIIYGASFEFDKLSKGGDKVQHAREWLIQWRNNNTSLSEIESFVGKKVKKLREWRQ